MVVRKVKNKSSAKDKWACLQLWMKEHGIPKPKPVKQTVLVRETDH